MVSFRNTARAVPAIYHTLSMMDQDVLSEEDKKRCMDYNSEKIKGLSDRIEKKRRDIHAIVDTVSRRLEEW